MTNRQFLDILRASFLKCLETSERSNEKLKILHGAISDDLLRLLRAHNDTGGCYSVMSLNKENGKEKKIAGHYGEKAVDITVCKNGKPIAGIAVKFVMSNYSQNSNNYFENMLGETANIRCKDIPYFQIFIIPDRIPYFAKNGKIKRWDEINKHNLQKYVVLSTDNADVYMHTPNKTLVFILRIPGNNPPCYQDKAGYQAFYLGQKDNANFNLKLSDKFNDLTFGDAVIYNDYEFFIKKTVHLIIGLK
ncbi:MAG: hypothetical protein ACI4RV_08970 [Eubacteriales bacterium]